MYINLPYANGKLFLNNTVIACDDSTQACTEFRFLITNTGSVTANAWYKVSIVGGGTLYTGTVPNLAPMVGSSYIDDWVCALPGGLPVGTHTVKVEVGVEGSATATDTYTEDIYVIEEPEPPVVDTDDAEGITATSAQLWGYLGECNGLLTSRNFEYGKTTSYGTTNWAGDTTEPGYFYKTITGLAPNTLYHFRAMATNFNGTGYGADITFTTLVESVANMYINLPYANGKLFLNNTVIACDDSTQACTEFRFLITNTGNVTANAWYKVSIVGGGTLYTGTVPNLAPMVGSSYIDDWVCALPGGLPVGTHTVKVEVGVEGSATATDTYTEDIYVIEEPVANMYINLPYANGKLFLNNTVIACDDSTQACTEFRFLITNTGNVTANAWYKVSIVGGGTLYTGTVPNLAPMVGSSYIDDWVCALPGGLPVGTHTVKVEVGVEGSATATDTYTEDIYVIEEPVANMYINLPYANGKLFLNNTVIACDDSTQACTEFRFLITNTGNVTANAWYKVSIVGGGTLYTGTVPNLAPMVGSSYIDDWVCALPGGLPVGTHTVKVEVGVEGSATATDTYTEDIYVIEEATSPSGVSTTDEHYLNVCDDEIVDNCISTDILVEHFGSDSECSVYLEYWSEGDTAHNFTTPIVVPYDPIYAKEGGLEVQGVTACIPNCELDHYIRAVASNSVGTSYSETVTPITVRLEPVVYITETTTTLNANILSMGTVSSGVWAFRYGTPTPNTWTPFSPILSTGSLGTSIQGLEPNTTYQYYLLAKNTYGYPQTQSSTMSFTTIPLNVPSMYTTWTSDITQTSAKLGGFLDERDGRQTHYGIEYGETTNYGTILWVGYETWIIGYDAIIEGLSSNTTYHFRAIGTNDNGTGYGVDESFTTLAVLVYDMSIVLPNANGKLFLSNTITACDDPADACTLYRFQIKNDGNVAMKAWFKVSVIGGGTLYEGSYSLTLDPGETSDVINNVVCAPADLPVGTHTIKVEVGPVGKAVTDTVTDVIYVTEEPEPPSVSTTSSDGISQSSATLHGNLLFSSGVSTHIGFEYGKTTSYGITVWDTYTSSTGSYDKVITGLTQNTTYHFRAIATNEYGTGYGSDKAFTTLAVPLYDMSIVLPNANGKLFLSNTITACDDSAKACTEFRFQIKSNGNVAIGAWYKVSVVGGGTLYDSTIASINPGATSIVIADWVCALLGGLPVGEHTIKVEVGPVGKAVTDTVTDVIYVTEEPEPPSVSTTSSDGISQSSATLHGNLLFSSGVSTHIGFEYGKTTSYGTTVWDTYTSSTGSYDKVITGLTQNTTYHFRAIATNEHGTGYGSDKAFTTLSATLDITFIATAPGISDLHNVDVSDVSDPENPLYLGRT